MRNLLEGIVVAVLVACTFAATYVLTSQPEEPAIAAEAEAAPARPSVAAEAAEPEVPDPPLQWSEDEETTDGESAVPPDGDAEGRETGRAETDTDTESNSETNTETEDAAPEPELDRAPESSDP